MMISESDANCCGAIFIGIVIVILACIGFGIHDHYVEKATMANFHTITVPIDGAIVNTYGWLSAVWVKSETGALIAVPPDSYLPPICRGEGSFDIVPISVSRTPLVYDDALNKASQTLLIKKQDESLYYELHLIKDTKPVVNSASHGKWGEY